MQSKTGEGGEPQRQALALKARSKTWSVTVCVGLYDYLGGRMGQSDPTLKPKSLLG